MSHLVLLSYCCSAEKKKPKNLWLYYETESIKLILHICNK